MNRLRRQLRQHRQLAAAILALALALRALVPAGYMPAFDRGSVGVRICDGQIARSMPHGMGHGTGHDGEPGHADQPCAFAGLSAPVAPPPGVVLAPPPARPVLSFVAIDRAAASVGAIRALPPARAPPTLA